MDNAKKFLLGIVALIIGFYVGRTFLPAGAASRYVIPLGGQGQPAAPVPSAAPTTPQPSGTYTPLGATAYPTPYPTPPIQGNVATLPYTPPANPPNQAGAVSNASRLPSASDLGNVDWGTHLPYIILALLALAVAAKKYSDARTLCVALFVLGAIAGRYLDFGPIAWPKAVGVVIPSGLRGNLS